jgi:hypothetical protein
MRDQLRPALVVVMIVAGLLSAGCGSSDNHAASVHAGAESTPTGVSTKAQFVTQAQAICQGLSASEKPLKARQETLKSLPSAAADKLFVSTASSKHSHDPLTTLRPYPSCSRVSPQRSTTRLASPALRAAKKAPLEKHQRTPSSDRSPPTSRPPARLACVRASARNDGRRQRRSPFRHVVTAPLGHDEIVELQAPADLHEYGAPGPWHPARREQRNNG